MRRTGFGFLGGAAAALLTVWLADPGPKDPDSGTGPATERSSGASPARQDFNDAGIAQDNSDRSPAGTGVTEGSAVPTRALQQSLENDDARASRLTAEIDATERALAGLRAELEQLAIAQELAARPLLSPITLPPEFDWVAENSYRGLFHERMQREPIDAAWASATEFALLNVVYNRPAIVQKYGAPTVRCHTTQCEVTFLATGLVDDPSVAKVDAKALFDASFEELDDKFDCGPGDCWADAENQNGVVTIFWGMTKGENQPQSPVSVTTALR